MSVEPEFSVRARDRKRLETIARLHKANRTLSRNVKAILLAASGQDDREIAKRLRVSRVQVRQWRSRYAQDGMASILDKLPAQLQDMTKTAERSRLNDDATVSTTIRPSHALEEQSVLRNRVREAPPKLEFLQIMRERGFIADCTDYQRLETALRSGVATGYIGFDATARSLHVGSLIQIMMLRWFQKTGHRPIVLMGGGTSMVGDPSFRAEERPLLTPENITKNIDSIRTVFMRFLDFDDGPTGAVMPDNAEWLKGLRYLDFLRDVGRHFSVNRMLGFDSVKSRLSREQSLSFLEFNYMILQAYDFAELNRRYGCILQMGGSDQWGNIVNGIDLTRRLQDAEVYGLTSPLLTTAGGDKMGKSVGGAVWLNSEMLGAYEFWQYWRNVDDADVGRFLKLYTEIPVSECDLLGALRNSEINEAKIRLANEVTALCHGEQAAKAAEATSAEVFAKGGVGDALPSLELSPSEIGKGISVAQLLVRSGLASSGKEARRLLAGNGVRINGLPLTDAGLTFSADSLASPVRLSAGRKRHVLIALAV